MSTMVRAAVATEPRHTEVKEFSLPEIPPDAGLMRVEATGICGSDWGMYLRGQPGPRILGHEMIGTVEKIGDVARERWGVTEGDLVALEEYLPCGHCEYCRTGEYRSCLETDTRIAGSIRYGSTPLTVTPSLWGGYAQYLYMHPRSVLHNVPAGVPAHIAAMALPIGNGFQWAYLDGGAIAGQDHRRPGPRPTRSRLRHRGEVGGGGARIIVTGLARDERRLAVAARTRRASHRHGRSGVISSEAVRRITGGRMADIVIDSSGGGPDIVNPALGDAAASAASWSCRRARARSTASTSTRWSTNRSSCAARAGTAMARSSWR